MTNRTAATLGTSISSYTYQSVDGAMTSKLASVTEGTGTRSVAYDAAGNEVQPGTSSFVYSPRNYLDQADGLRYLYDGALGRQDRRPHKSRARRRAGRVRRRDRLFRLHHWRELSVVIHEMFEMRWIAFLTSVVSIFFFACSTRTASRPVPADRLDLRLLILDTASTDATIEIRNLTSEPIAIGDVFGFKRVYLDVEVRDRDGHIDDSSAELFSRPKGRCIPPGQSFRMPVLLRHPARRFNGSVDAGDFRYPPLAPGRYEARAVYRSPPVPLKSKCATIKGEIASGWIQFEIKE